MLENKLKISNEIELAKEEEKITKLKALELFDTKKIYGFEVGTINGLCRIHEYLFQDIYEFAGKVREKNISKGNTGSFIEFTDKSTYVSLDNTIWIMFTIFTIFSTEFTT